MNRQKESAHRGHGLVPLGGAGTVSASNCLSSVYELLPLQKYRYGHWSDTKVPFLKSYFEADHVLIKCNEVHLETGGDLRDSIHCTQHVRVGTVYTISNLYHKANTFSFNDTRNLRRK